MLFDCPSQTIKISGYLICSLIMTSHPPTLTTYTSQITSHTMRQCHQFKNNLTEIIINADNCSHYYRAKLNNKYQNYQTRALKQQFT